MNPLTIADNWLKTTIANEPVYIWLLFIATILTFLMTWHYVVEEIRDAA